MQMNEYQRLALRTAAPATDQMHLIHAALGLAGEAGEFADAVKRAAIYGRPLDNLNLKEEIGDILWYCALAAESIGYSLQDIASDNIAKLARRYPEKFTTELSEKRLDKE
jgi:NTP pyrophosphatase (non-canonical NTP hydrolase)